MFASSGVHTFSLAARPLPSLIALPLYVRALAEQARLSANLAAQSAAAVH